jgi:hypothetical protein
LRPGDPGMVAATLTSALMAAKAVKYLSEEEFDRLLVVMLAEAKRRGRLTGLTDTLCE